MAVRWIDQRIHFLDFEGGLSSGVLEYGVVTVKGGEVVETRSRLCRPKAPIDPRDTAIHGLTESAVGTAAPLAEDWTYFAGLRQDGPLAAHFAGVENALLKATWAYPRMSPDFGRGGEIADWGPWLDTARLYGQLHPEQPSGLEALVAACGLQPDLDRLAADACPPTRRVYHCALYDALAGALLLNRLAADPQVRELSLRQVLALSTLDPRKREDMVQERFW